MHLLPENMVDLSAARIQQLQLPILSVHDLTLDVLRLDSIDPVISGNKWFKLQYYLEDALQKGQKKILTFGGAWSNHIVATACASHKAGLKSIGIIRGEKPDISSSTLLKAGNWGMQLQFISREQYRQKNDPSFMEQLLPEYNDCYIIPEGGASIKGIQGAAEIIRLIKPEAYTHLICAVGTGTLLYGLASGAMSCQHIIGIRVLKGWKALAAPGYDPRLLQHIQLLDAYHHGGYARKNPELLQFMNRLYEQTGIPTDFVYTGKMFFGIFDAIEKGFFPRQGRLLAIHSGGLQGNDSLAPGSLVF